MSLLLCGMVTNTSSNIRNVQALGRLHPRLDAWPRVVSVLLCGLVTNNSSNIRNVQALVRLRHRLELVVMVSVQYDGMCEFVVMWSGCK